MEKGRVIEVVSNTVNVELENNLICNANIKGAFRKEEIFPVVGDNVLVDIFEKSNSGEVIEGIICEILDRDVYIKRPKVANITKLFFVISIDKPKPDLLMLDKQIAFAELLKVKIVIVLNKVDLGDEKYIQEIKDVYEKVGYKVIVTQGNSSENSRVDEIKSELSGNISAFSGNSGVGKSTLINSLFNSYITLEGEISQKNKRGKNTTTSTKLYKLEEDTYIADTPGFSTFSIEEISYRDLDKYYKEFKEYIINCEYIGCTHIKEENCGIKEAVLNSSINKKRYERYIKIYEELKNKEERKKW